MESLQESLHEPIRVNSWTSNLDEPNIDEYSPSLRKAFAPLLEPHNKDPKCGVARRAGRELLQRIVLRANRFELSWSSHYNHPFLLTIHVLNFLAQDSCL